MSNDQKTGTTPTAPKEGKKDSKDGAVAATGLPNRPGEPEFKLVVSPELITFVCTPDKKPVWCDIKLLNNTKDKQSYKVKCTSADIFRVQPPFGFVKANESTQIRIWFQNKNIPEVRHYFAIYHLKCAEGKPAKDLWAKNTKAEGVRRLLAVFEKSAPVGDSK